MVIGMTEKAIKEYLSEMGRKGGKAQVPKGVSMLSDKDRKAIAMKGVEARRAKAKKAKKNVR